MGIPANSIAEAVFARCLSALKEERVAAGKVLHGPAFVQSADQVAKWFGGKRERDRRHPRRPVLLQDLRLRPGLSAHARGARMNTSWKLNFAGSPRSSAAAASSAPASCRRSPTRIAKNSELVNLLLDGYFNEQIQKGQANWRKVIAVAATNGIAAPAFMSALAYYDGYRSARLPANLLQGQRDYFGAHTYERTD